MEKGERVGATQRVFSLGTVLRYVILANKAFLPLNVRGGRPKRRDGCQVLGEREGGGGDLGCRGLGHNIGLALAGGVIAL